jgi:hypothetical protein
METVWFKLSHPGSRAQCQIADQREGGQQERLLNYFDKHMVSAMILL